MTALSQKSLRMPWPSFFGGRETERGTVEASERWDRCHTHLHSAELWRGVSTVTAQRRWGLSPLPALRSTAVPMAPGTEPRGDVCPSGKLAEGLGGFAAAKVDGLMWFRGRAKACWGSQWWDLKNDSWILSLISMEVSHSQNFDCRDWAAKCSGYILAKKRPLKEEVADWLTCEVTNHTSKLWSSASGPKGCP